MKTLTLVAALFILSLTANAQLKNTKWKGIIIAPSEIDVVMQFKNDTLDVVIAGTDDVIESMKYSVKGDVITINKITGGSPCGNDQQATIKYVIKDDKLIFSQITDPCAEREKAWPLDGFTRM